MIDKFPIPHPSNYNRVEVVRVSPEILSNTVRKEVKTDDVMLQKAENSLLKGITAFTKSVKEVSDF